MRSKTGPRTTTGSTTHGISTKHVSNETLRPALLLVIVDQLPQSVRFKQEHASFRQVARAPVVHCKHFYRCFKAQQLTLYCIILVYF